jgi:mono/diheme cytochrome c family protein
MRARDVLTMSLLPAMLAGAAMGCSERPVPSARADDPSRADVATREQGRQEEERLIREGRQTFRYDTFGDEAFWGDVLRLHEAIEGAALGGVGPGVSPRTALAVGLKVDVDALRASVRRDILAGKVNLDDPATTLALLRIDAVVGVKGIFDAQGGLMSMGIRCALCHSTVDNSFAPGIGRRLDGWGNRDLDVGVIVSLSPNLQPVADLLSQAGSPVDVPTLKQVLATWGPGKYDAAVFLDGKALRPDGKPAATLIPSAFGLAGVNLHTWTGWGSVTHWNALVANLEMHGQGTFDDARLDDAATFPIAARLGLGHVKPPDGKPDLVTPRLAGLHVYQLSLAPPRPPAGFFDESAAARGKAIFEGKARCASCHVPPLYTEPGWNLHTPAEIAVDDFQANRSPDKRYRTAPLRALFARFPGGPPPVSVGAEPGPFFHDGRFATLKEVVQHYDATGVGAGGVPLGLSEAEVDDLVQFLRSL